MLRWPLIESTLEQKSFELYNQNIYVLCSLIVFCALVESSLLHSKEKVQKAAFIAEEQ